MSRYRTVYCCLVASVVSIGQMLASGRPVDPPLRDSSIFEQSRMSPQSVSRLQHASTEREGRGSILDGPQDDFTRPPTRTSSRARGSGDTWFVNASLGSGLNDGTSWADAFQGTMGLQAALGAAQAGDAVWIAAGTYLPDDAGDRDASFVIPDGVSIYGGFAGGEMNLADRDPALHEVVLSGDLLGDDGPDFANIADNARRVVEAAGVTTATIIDSVTIASGFAEQSGTMLIAAGLGCESGSPVVTACRFEFNTSRRGGAVYVADGSPEFTNCTFEDNRAMPDDDAGEGNGGAVSIMLGSDATFSDCMFTSNTARIGGAIHIAGAGATFDGCTFTTNQTILDEFFLGSLGGAMFIDSNETIALTSCDFLSNTARQGGGVDIEGGAPSFAMCDFIGNIAVTEDVAGGGLGGGATIAFGSSASFDQCEFNSNAARVGGGIHVFDSTPALTMCDFDDNEAVADEALGGGFGGAINLLANADATFTNCTINGNEARQGAGAQIEDAQPVFDGCTFFFNTAPTATTSGFGGAVLCFTDGDAVFTDTTFTGNTATFGGAVFGFGTASTFDICSFDLNGADQSGGAMYLQDAGNVRMTDTPFDTNTAVAGGGGAVFIDNTPAAMRGCTCTDNQATDGSGGAVAIVDGSAAIVFDCTFTDNEATNGGGVRVNGSPATIVACSFLSNSASSAGGGVDFVGGELAAMRSCVSAGNDAAFGGGVHVSGLGPTLANLTITENTSANGAGVRSSNMGEMVIVNSIIWNNTGDETDTGADSMLTISFSDVQGGVTRGGTGNIDADPQFTDAPGGDYTLSPGSPCIDIGSNADADPCDPDRALGLRILDGAGSEVVDMGAYELGPGVFTDCNGNLILDSCDLANMTEQDCNSNGVPDSCDIAQNGWADEDADMVPDLCQRLEGDVNNDGVVGLADLLGLLSSWGGCSGDCIEPCEPDVDSNCQVGLGDLLIVLSNWGSMAS